MVHICFKPFTLPQTRNSAGQIWWVIRFSHLSKNNTMLIIAATNSSIVHEPRHHCWSLYHFAISCLESSAKGSKPHIAEKTCIVDEPRQTSVSGEGIK